MTVSLHTSLCDTFGIRYPIVKAGMGGGTDTPELAAAVSAAGGLGLFGAILLDPNQLRAAIRRIRALRGEEGAAEIVARLVRETEAVLEKMSHSYVL